MNLKQAKINQRIIGKSLINVSFGVESETEKFARPAKLGKIKKNVNRR